MSEVAEQGRDGDGRSKRRRTGAAFAGRQCLSEYPPRLDGCLWERLTRVLRSTAMGRRASDVWGILCGCAGQGEALPIRPVAAGWREARVLFCGSEHGASVEEAGPGGRRAVLVSNTEVMCRYRHLFTDISVTRRWVALLSVPESPSPGH